MSILSNEKTIDFCIMALRISESKTGIKKKDNDHEKFYTQSLHISVTLTAV